MKTLHSRSPRRSGALTAALLMALACATPVFAGPLPVARAVLRGAAHVTYPTGLGVEQDGGTLLLMEHATLTNSAAETVVSLRNGDRLALGRETRINVAEGPRVGLLAGGLLFHLDATEHPTALRLAGYAVKAPENVEAVRGLAAIDRDSELVVEAIESPLLLVHPDGREVLVPAGDRMRLAAVDDQTARIVLTQQPTGEDLELYDELGDDEMIDEEDDDDDAGLLLEDEVTGEEAAGLLFGLSTTTVITTTVGVGVIGGSVIVYEEENDDDDGGGDDDTPRGPVSIASTPNPVRTPFPTPTPQETPFDEKVAR